MSLCKRLIARLDIKGSRLIKGIRFEGLRVLGDPWDAALRYTEAGADELLYVDAVASLYGRNGLADLLRRTSREVFIPITAGGGVRTVQDAAVLLAAGADKIAVNTAALQRPELITELAEAFGSQCVVASIQARRTAPGSWEAMAEAGRERSGRDVLAWIEQAQELGAGELLLTSVDQDGTCAGPDQALLEAAAGLSRVPLVFGGGFAAVDQMVEAWRQPQLAAVCLGAALHHARLELSAVKSQLASLSNLPIRPCEAGAFQPSEQPLIGRQIGVIDYGMGNQQSLINALERLGAQTLLSDQPDQLANCSLLALPGVGAFPQGIQALRDRGLDDWLSAWVAKDGPLLGICLGMQMLFESSEEFAPTPGLGFLPGKVVRMPDQTLDGQSLTLPHMGWNQLSGGPAALQPASHENLKTYQYFVHSYSVTQSPESSACFYSNYGGNRIVAAVQKDSILGFQFHPERSGVEGLRLLAAACNYLLHIQS